MTDRATVVVVEDDADVAYLLGMQLSERVEVVAILHDAREALAYPDWADVDLAVVDWMIPGGGDAVLRHLQDSHPDVARLLISAADPPVWVRAHADGFASKTSLRGLQVAVEELLHGPG